MSAVACTLNVGNVLPSLYNMFFDATRDGEIAGYEQVRRFGVHAGSEFPLDAVCAIRMCFRGILYTVQAYQHTANITSCERILNLPAKCLCKPI